MLFIVVFLVLYKKTSRINLITRDVFKVIGYALVDQKYETHKIKNLIRIIIKTTVNRHRAIWHYNFVRDQINFYFYLCKNLKHHRQTRTLLPIFQPFLFPKAQKSSNKTYPAKSQSGR